MIYNSFFGFKAEPFGVTPNPKFFYLSKGHEDALAHIKFGITENKGFVMLTGEIGSGKTTLMKYFIENLSENIHTSVILNPKVTPIELLKLINRDFGLTSKGDTYDDLIACLNEFLIECFSKGEKAAIFIDEAQSMQIESLEFVRLLSNLETTTKKLLDVVMIGQPELKDIIGSSKLKQLDQRISVRYHIGPLNKEEIGKYIQYRIKKAGSMLLFPPKSLKIIYRYSRGLPRLINIACDRILLSAYSEGQIKISKKLVKKSLKELGMKRKGLLLYVLAFLIASNCIVWIFNEQLINNILNFLNQREPVKIAEKPVLKPRFSINIEGMVIVSNPSDTKDACFLSLLTHWGETNLPLAQESEKVVAERGYSIYSFGNDWQKLIRLNMPCLIQIDENYQKKWVVLLWIINGDAVIFDPLSGRQIIRESSLRNSVSQFVMLWKNKYNNPDKVLELQKILKAEGLFTMSETGVFGKNTKKALLKFQEQKGFPVTGEFDEETMLMLSKDELTPEVFSKKIKRGTE